MGYVDPEITLAHGSQRPSAVWYVGSMWLYFISLSQHRLRSARIVLATNLGSIVGVSVGDGAHKNACLDRRRDQALDRTRAPENECASDREAAWTPHSFRQTTRSPAGIGSAGGQTQTFSNSLTEAATRFALDALPEPQRAKAILDLRDRVINGDFDASAEESEEWANSPEGQDAMRLVERFTLLGVTFKNWIIAALAIVLVGTLLAWWIQR